MDYADARSLDLLQSPVNGDLGSLDMLLQEVLLSDVPLIDEVSRYILDTPGKRIRPTVLFLAARSLGESSKGLVTAGLAVELIHSATLVHDDIIDNHQVRRGRPTICAKWGKGTATIFGDFLYSKAFSILGGAGLYDVMELLARVSHMICVGEILQSQQRQNIDISEETYLDVISKKTASLFSASCESGVLIGGGGNGLCSLYSDFGEKIGLAFQITDDLCDFIAIDERIGKPIASDLTGGKVTLPFITALRNAPDQQRKRVSDLFDTGIDRYEHWNEIVSFIKNYGGVEYSLRKAREFGEGARRSLKDIEPSPEKEALFFAADYVVDRVESLF